MRLSEILVLALSFWRKRQPGSDCDIICDAYVFVKSRPRAMYTNIDLIRYLWNMAAMTAPYLKESSYLGILSFFSLSFLSFRPFIGLPFSNQSLNHEYCRFLKAQWDLS